MSEGRKIFPLDTILALLSGVGGADTSGLLSFMTAKELNPEQEAIVAPLAQAWLCKLHPAFLESKFSEDAPYENWVAAEKKRIGDNVSLTPIPEAEMTGIETVLSAVDAAKATAAEKTEEAEALAAKVAELEPFEAKAGELEKKVEGLEGQVASLQEEVSELKSKNAEFEGKLPVDENGLNDSIKEIVTKALKDAVASVPMGAAAGAAAEGGDAAPAEEAVEDSGPAPDFGFGSSGDDADGFGF